MTTVEPAVSVLVCGARGYLAAAHRAIEQLLGKAYEAGDIEAVRTLTMVTGIMNDMERRARLPASGAHAAGEFAP